MKKILKGLTMLFVCVFMLTACSLTENETSNSQLAQDVENSNEVKEEIRQSEEFNTQDIEEVEESLFIPDYEEISEINSVGNTAANLGNGGGVTSQGKWTYYYNKGEIRKINDNGECLYVCTAPKARCLNVIGDWIYYFADTSIYRVHTDGSSQEVLIANEVASEIFYVIDNCIYYLRKNAVSATSSEYLLEAYNVEMESSICMGAIANVDDFVKFNGYGLNSIYFKCRYLADRSTGFYKYKEFKFDLVNCEIVSLDTDPVPYGVAYVEDDILYENGLIRTDAISYMTVDNVNEGRIFESGVVVGEGYKLWYIESDDYVAGAEPQNIRHLIISEKELMESICVVGDYVYYRMRSANYDDSPLYRVKISGTDWEELP